MCSALVWVEDLSERGLNSSVSRVQYLFDSDRSEYERCLLKKVVLSKSFFGDGQPSKFSCCRVSLQNAHLILDRRIGSSFSKWISPRFSERGLEGIWRPKLPHFTAYDY